MMPSAARCKKIRKQLTGTLFFGLHGWSAWWSFLFTPIDVLFPKNYLSKMQLATFHYIEITFWVQSHQIFTG